MSLYPHLTFSAFYGSFHFPNTTTFHAQTDYDLTLFFFSHKLLKWKIQGTFMGYEFSCFTLLLFLLLERLVGKQREGQELQCLSKTRQVLRRNFCKFSDTNGTMYVSDKWNPSLALVAEIWHTRASLSSWQFPLKVCWVEFHLEAACLLVFEFWINFITRIVQFSIIFKLHIQAQFFNPCSSLIIEV